MVNFIKVLFIASVIVLSGAAFMIFKVLNSGEHSEGAGYVVMFCGMFGVVSLVMAIGSGWYMARLPGQSVAFKICIGMIVMFVVLLHLVFDPFLR